MSGVSWWRAKANIKHCVHTTMAPNNKKMSKAMAAAKEAEAAAAEYR
jgi:hypothetical protein